MRSNFRWLCSYSAAYVDAWHACFRRRP